MKKVLLSVHPKWCELIFNGKKTIEVRKNIPKLEPPFEVLVYCTQKGRPLVWGTPCVGYVDERLTQTYGYGLAEAERIFDEVYNGKVIGSFVCDEIYAFFPWDAGIACEDIDGNLLPADKVCKETCLTGDEIYKYFLGNGKETFEGYGWHISDFKIYDKPKELGEFRKVCLNGKCSDCIYEECKITRPPQSWCYVEEI